MTKVISYNLAGWMLEKRKSVEIESTERSKHRSTDSGKRKVCTIITLYKKYREQGMTD